MNDGAGDGKDIRYTENNHTLHFNQLSDEEKGCDIVGTAYAVMNDGAGDGKDIRYTENNHTLHFNHLSDEEKGCDIVGTAYAVFHAKTMLYRTVSETIDSLRKRRNCVSATNNHYR